MTEGLNWPLLRALGAVALFWAVVLVLAEKCGSSPKRPPYAGFGALAGFVGLSEFRFACGSKSIDLNPPPHDGCSGVGFWIRSELP